MAKEQKKIAVISGGMGYVGKAIAVKLASEGMSVALICRTASKESANAFLASLGEGHSAYRCDLEDAPQVQKTLATIEREHGEASVYVHAAGLSPSRTPLHLSSAKDVLKAFKGNALSGFNFLATGAAHLKMQRKGVLIGVTTAAVISPSQAGSLGAYVPAKYALQGILASFRTELLPFGIRVYSVAPGFMEGGMNSMFPKAFVAIVKAKSPTKKLATAEDVAERVSFLISDAGKGIAELTIVVAPELGTV